jgi:hypothetical protein
MASGYQDLTGQVTIQRLTAPLWQERATLIAEPGPPAEVQGEMGLRFIAAMSKTGEPMGYFIQSN